MSQKIYFERPTQVVFLNPEPYNDEVWCAGIAYRDEIICACCGGIFEIPEIIETAKECGCEAPIYEYDSWADLRDEIIGDELPNISTFGFNDIIDV